MPSNGSDNITDMDIDQSLTVRVKDALPIAKALSTQLRIDMFLALMERPLNIVEIADRFDLPVSTVASNINILEDAGLIITELLPGMRGRQKLCAVVLSRIVLEANAQPRAILEENFLEIPMPIGNFVNFSVAPTCGLASSRSLIGELDDETSFYEPDRTSAQLVWFHKGFVEYWFPNRVPRGASMKSLELTMEVCSEAPMYNSDWPSDITVWINHQEIGTWTSPGDFGGERGFLTPAWWTERQTQYGLLKTWRVTNQGSFVDGRNISPVRLAAVWQDTSPGIVVRIGVKDDARNIGGINLFGRRFGNYETDLVLRLGFENH